VENLGVGGTIILKRIFKKRIGWGEDWVDLAKDRGNFRTLVKAVMNL